MSCPSGAADILPFDRALADNGLTLIRQATTTLQVNVGLACNLQCKHCHVEAGPHRTESMDATTVGEVADYVARSSFSVVDITGGAPEMNPHLVTLIERVGPQVGRVMVRTNLTLLTRPAYRPLVDIFREHGVALVASLPSLNRAQADAQRGEGTFDGAFAAIRLLNEAGYGVEGSGLEFDLVANPTGAFLGPSQGAVEKRFREVMERKHGLRFTSLFTFANVPLGRFGRWLTDSGNMEGYYRKLADSFNPGAVDGVMCRYQVSVGWDGMMYDCDFHVATGVPLGGTPIHVRDMPGAPSAGSPIALCDYCYTCTAGAGFTCGGSIE
jgi:radical SAM/Cys-rich protein